MAIIIPRSTSKLTTKGTADIQTPSDFSKVERAVQGLGEQVSAVSQIFRKGIITEQVSKATLETNRQLNELQIKTLKDPNLTESSAVQYRAGADKILGKAMDGIGDPVATREFQVQHQGVVMSRENAVRNAGRRAQTDRYTVQTNEIGEQALDNTFNTNNPASQEIERQKYISQLNRGVENLWLSRVERQTAITKWDEARRVGKPQHDFNILTAPGDGVTWGQRAAGAEAFIQQVRAGAYPSLTPQEQTEFINKAEAFRDVSQTRDRVAIDNRQFDAWKEVLPQIKAGTITEPELRLKNFSTEAGKDDGEISDADLTKALLFLNSKKGVSVKTDNGVYHSIEKMISGQDKNPKTNDFWTHSDISDEIDRNYFDLDEEDMQQLINSNTSEKRGRTKSLVAAASKGLEGRITQQVVKSDDILFGTVDPDTGLVVKAGLVGGDVTAAKAAKAVADEYMARFDRRIAIERATTQEDIRKIELEIENEFRKDNDLSIVGGNQPNISIGVGGEIKRHFEGKSDVKPQFKLVPVGAQPEE